MARRDCKGAPFSDMHGKVCLVTGGSSGIGKEAALGLARLGATVVMVSRDRSRGEAARADIVNQSGNSAVDVLLADLASQQAIRRVADEFKGKHQQLHVLLNNAGAINGSRVLTEDGLETTFAVNHLAYFLLTNLLLGALKGGAPARVVNVSSDAHLRSWMRFDDLQGAKRYSAMSAYGQSKLANILFTYELARRLDGAGVTANCFHPGAIASGFGHNVSGWYGFGIRLAAPFMSKPEQGAATALFLAASPEADGVSGKYLDKCHTSRSSPASYDEAAAQRLWQVSAELTGLGTTP